MIHWGWVAAAFVAGSLFGVVLMAQFAAKGQGDRCAECKYREITGDEYRALARMDVSGIGRDPNLSDLAEEHNLEVER